MTEGSKLLTERDRQLRRREWLMLYLPLIVGAALALALVAVIAVLGFKDTNLGSDPASAWGDAGAIIVIVEVLLASLVPLALLVALCALFIWLFIKVQPALRRGQVIAELVHQEVDRAADRLTATLVKPCLLGARVRAFSQFLRRIDV